MSRGPLVLGDLGHSLFRLSRARATSRAVGFDVKEVLYPGFEGRPEAESFDAFMESVEMQVDVYRLSHSRPLVYATGFGALVLNECIHRFRSGRQADQVKSDSTDERCLACPR